MLEDEIVARARREVAARPVGEHAEPKGRIANRALPALALAVLLTYFAIPVPLPRKLLLAMGGVCSLRPGHSYFAGDLQLPLESRMLGIYAGFLLSTAVLLLAGRFRARRLGNVRMLGVLLLMFGSMAFDGINSTFAEVGAPHLYTPTNEGRLITGLLAGIALSTVITWLVGGMALPRSSLREQPVIRGLHDLLAPLALCAAFAALVLQERAILYYPIAFVSVGGIVTALTAVALLVVLGIRGQPVSPERPRLLWAPLSLALLLAFATLGLTAALRWSFAGVV